MRLFRQQVDFIAKIVHDTTNAKLLEKMKNPYKRISLELDEVPSSKSEAPENSHDYL